MPFPQSRIRGRCRLKIGRNARFEAVRSDLLVIGDDEFVEAEVLVIYTAPDIFLLHPEGFPDGFDKRQIARLGIEEESIPAFKEGSAVGFPDELHHFPADRCSVCVIEHFLAAIFDICAAAADIAVEAEHAHIRIDIDDRAPRVDKEQIARFPRFRAPRRCSPARNARKNPP